MYFVVGWVWSACSALSVFTEHPKCWFISTHEPLRLIFASVATSQSQSLDLSCVSDMDLGTQQNRALFSAWGLRMIINSSALISEQCFKVKTPELM